MHTMTEREHKARRIAFKALVGGDRDFLRELIRTTLQEVLEAEMTEALGAAKSERTMGRNGYRSGYYGRSLITRVGKLELRGPQDRSGEFLAQLFERYQRSERALVAALAEMYVQGVSTRKVKAITEELCGHSFSASSISAINQRLDQSLAQFAARPLSQAFPYLIVDARYERVREAGVIVSRAVLIAIGIDWDGRRQILGVELANRESRSSWSDFLRGLKARGSTAWSWSSPTIMRGSRRRFVKSCRKPSGSVATFISSATPWTMYRARSMTIACKSCAGFTPAAIWPRHAAI